MSLFVRITRGLHVVESASAVSSSLPLDGDSVGRNIGDTKHPTAAWSWRWEEALAVPGLEVARAKHQNQREAGGEGDEKEGRVADPLLAATHVHERHKASKPDHHGTEGTAAHNTPPGEGVSTGLAASGDAAADDVQGDRRPSSFQVGADVDPSRGDSTDSSESRRESATVASDRPTGGGIPDVEAEAASPRADAGEKTKRGVSFWSPRRGRRKTDAAARDERASDVFTSHHGSGAVSTTPDAAVVAGHERPGSSGSSIDSETSVLDTPQRSRARKPRDGKSSRHPTSSGKICPEAVVKVKDTVVAEGAGSGEAGGDDVTTRKRAVSFWGNKRGDGHRHASRDTVSTADEPDSRALGRCDSEASSVFDISDPENDPENDGGTSSGKPEELAADVESGMANVAHGSLRSNKTGGSFLWSPRRGRRRNVGAARDKPTSGVPTSKHESGTVSKTMPDAAGTPRDERSRSSGSSIDSETSESDEQQRFRSRNAPDGKAARRSASSDLIYPEVLVKVNDTVIAEGAGATAAVDTEAIDDGVAPRKKAVSFWGNRIGRRNQHASRDAASTIDEPDSQALGRHDSEASSVFDISDPEDGGDGTATDKPEGLAPYDESGMTNVSHGSVRSEKAGGSFLWSPRRKGNKGAKKAEETDGDAHGDPGSTATTTGLSLFPAEVASKASASRDPGARRRRRVPWKDSTAASDVMLLEIWQVKKGADVSSPRSTSAADVAVAPGCGDGNTTADLSRHARESEEPRYYSEADLDGMGESSHPLVSGEGGESLPAKGSEHTPPLGATVETAETAEDPPHACDDDVNRPGTDVTGGSSTIASATGEGCVEDDGTSAGNGDEVSALDDEASVSSKSPTKKSSGRKRLVSFLSPSKRGRAKGEVPSKLASSETESPRGSTLTVHDTREEGDKQREEPTVRAKGGRNASERDASETAPLDSRVSDSPERSSTDDEGDDGEGSAAAKQSQEGRQINPTFLSSYTRGRKIAAQESPRPASQPKPVLWGRLTIRVADVLVAGRSRGASDDDHRLVDGRNVSDDGTGLAKGIAPPDCSQSRPSTLKNVEGSWSSAFGTGLARRGLPKKKGASHTEAALGLKSARDGSTSGLSPSGTGLSAVDGWFEVEHPKGRRGKWPKGRVHLTITRLEPRASSDNNT